MPHYRKRVLYNITSTYRHALTRANRTHVDKVEAFSPSTTLSAERTLVETTIMPIAGSGARVTVVSTRNFGAVF